MDERYFARRAEVLKLLRGCGGNELDVESLAGLIAELEWRIDGVENDIEVLREEAGNG
jgi:hypothetical protein